MVICLKSFDPHEVLETKGESVILGVGFVLFQASKPRQTGTEATWIQMSFTAFQWILNAILVDYMYIHMYR